MIWLKGKDKASILSSGFQGSHYLIELQKRCSSDLDANRNPIKGSFSGFRINQIVIKPVCSDVFSCDIVQIKKA